MQLVHTDVAGTVYVPVDDFWVMKILVALTISTILTCDLPANNEA